MEKADVSFVKLETDMDFVRIYFNSTEAKEYVQNQGQLAPHIQKDDTGLWIGVQDGYQDSMAVVLDANNLTHETE